MQTQTETPDVTPQEARTIKPTLVAMDETTYWNFAAEDRAHIKAAYGIYLLDRGCVTHCCEVTPSYFMEFICNRIECTEDTPEDVRQAIYERYENEPSENTYMHCSGIDRFVEKHKDEKGTFRVHCYEDVLLDEDGRYKGDQDRDEYMKDFREYNVQGNNPLV